MRAGSESIDSYFFEKGKSTRLFWPVLALVVGVVAVTSKQDDFGVLAVGALLAVVAIYPFYFWLMDWSRGLPIWPLFAAMTGMTASLPMFQESATLEAYTPLEITVGGMTVVGFILLGTVVWLTVSSSRSGPPREVIMISRKNAEACLIGFLALGFLYHLNTFTGLVQLPGNLMQIFRGIAGVLSLASIFVLSYLAGRGLLSRGKSIFCLALMVGTVVMILTSLLMAQAIAPVALAVFGHALGRRRFPLKVAVFICLTIAVLHAGKFHMRNVYWGGLEDNPRPAVVLSNLPSFFHEWIAIGISGVAGLKLPGAPEKTQEATSSLFERTGDLHMLLLVQKKTPGEVPYCLGKTYEPILRLLVPRFIDQEKGTSHMANVMLTVIYGLQTIEQTRTTSIHWGLLPEAYANFGYMGVAVLAILLGAFYGWVGNLTVGVPMTSLRFVLALMFMAGAARADTMGIFVTSQFQGVVGACLAAMVLMKRQPNPVLAQEQREVAAENKERAGRWERTRHRREQATRGRGRWVFGPLAQRAVEADGGTMGLRASGSESSTAQRDDRTAGAERRQVTKWPTDTGRQDDGPRDQEAKSIRD